MTKPFPPIAIIGRGCVLPGALTPTALWERVAAGDDLVTDTPLTRWRVQWDDVEPRKDRHDGDSCPVARGGYVRGFEPAMQELLKTTSFPIQQEALAQRPVMDRWVLYAAMQAMTEAGLTGTQRTGAILGNLSFPSSEMSAYAETVWLRANAASVPLNQPKPPAQHRYMSGAPVHFLRQALGLGPCAFALDAACASAIYAIKLAADRLHDGSADVMLAGAVNRADDLFIHMGFHALNALSPTGQTRPFHAGADGLVPGEGCVVVALKRLEDAHAHGDKVLGVIHGIGLSNDGRDGSLLAPSQRGQVLALRRAYDSSTIHPSDIQLIEAHATGTQRGDATELATLSEVFGTSAKLPIGSLKSNMGHLITAAGGAALLKVLGAMDSGVMPPTLHADEPLEALEGFRLLTAAQDWPTQDGHRTAGINAFGFGGNNAHMIVRSDTGPRQTPNTSPPAPSPALAIVGMGGAIGGHADLGAFHDALADLGKDRALQNRTMTTITLPLEGVRAAPRDLEQSLGQQTAILRASMDAVCDAGLSDVSGAHIAIGAQTDPEVCRYGLRWRLQDYLRAWRPDASEDAREAWLRDAREAIVPPLEAAGVVGRMPNIPANRLNVQFDVTGPSFTVAGEHETGGAAFEVGARALMSGQTDLAIIGASDLSAEAVHRSQHHAPERVGDAALVLVLMRSEDAKREGRKIYAELNKTRWLNDARTREQYGDEHGGSHACAGLVDLVVQTLSCTNIDGPDNEATWRSSDSEAWQISRSGAWSEKGRRPETIALDGRTIDYPAHPPAVEIPRLFARSSQYAAAPRLPSHRETPPSSGAFQEVAARHPAPSSTRRQVVTPEPSFPVGPASPYTGLAIAAAVRDLREQHETWVAQQFAMHQQYLAVAYQASNMLRMRNTGGLVRPATPPTPSARAPGTSHSTRPSPPLRDAPSTEHHNPDNPVAPPVTPRPHPSSVTAPDEYAPPKPSMRTPTGPTYSRQDLEHLSTGPLGPILGQEFATLDQYDRLVRMPEPPLLLADRVVGLDATPFSMERGTIWTETDVTKDSWYLHDDRIPAGVMIEAGQADLLLISYLGIDKHNAGERVYRLLGCTLTYHGGLPRSGETLRYEIDVDGHAQHGPIRLFFFHYDCTTDGELRLTVRGGQAGFFTDQELLDSGGIFWEPADEDIRAEQPWCPPPLVCGRQVFDADDIHAFAEGRGGDVFGEGFERLHTHTKTPCMSTPPMLFWTRVVAFEPTGGPWGRGYLRAEQDIVGDEWFFDGHFKGDPCMPGTLMFEGCLQAMAFYMAACGWTIHRDGWSFEPVPDTPYDLSCRGQVTPDSKHLVYELFIEEVHDGEVPMLFAHLLCTVDGLKAFHGKRVGLQLVPDTPLSRQPAVVCPERDQYAVSREGVRLGYASMLASALGKPSDAFGRRLAKYDEGRHVARLPGPPYHFMTRVVSMEGDTGRPEPGLRIELEYDVPADAWYFDTQAADAMPFCVLLEAALQPCGWIAVFSGSTLDVEQPLYFRNLDGKGRLLADVTRHSGVLRTVAELTSVHHASGMIIESFVVDCFVGSTKVYELETTFGFFPTAALANQIGMPPSEEEAELLLEVGPSAGTIASQASTYAEGALSLPTAPALMIDNIRGVWASGGAKELGRIVTSKEVDPKEWFFKAHFYRDPVQPGSLGIEAMIQTLQAFIIEQGLAADFDRPVFEPLAQNSDTVWSYRGQVLPENERVTVEMDITSIQRDSAGLTVSGDGWLWVDGLRIYRADGLTVRVVEQAPESVLGVPTPQGLAEWWSRAFGGAVWPMIDLAVGLVPRFVDRVDGLEAACIAGRQVLFVANHQTAIESMLFATVMSPRLSRPTCVLAKAEHRESWLGWLLSEGLQWPNATPLSLMHTIQRGDPTAAQQDLARFTEHLRATGHNGLVHIEGTRAKEEGQPVQSVSAAVLELATELGLPIVPVWFSSGLVHSADAPMDFPAEFRRQCISIGPAIDPATLSTKPLSMQKDAILQAINTLATTQGTEPQPIFEARVRARMADYSTTLPEAVFAEVLKDTERPCPGTLRVLDALNDGGMAVGDDDHDRWLAAFASKLYGPRWSK